MSQSPVALTLRVRFRHAERDDDPAVIDSLPEWGGGQPVAGNLGNVATSLGTLARALTETAIGAWLASDMRNDAGNTTSLPVLHSAVDADPVGNELVRIRQ